MNTYIFQPTNYMNHQYFGKQASLKRFLLHIFDAVQQQTVEIIELMVDMEKYLALFYIPVIFKPREYVMADARSPPYYSPNYSEV